jgi:tetratricopeptide (TPR) repeat protein
MPMMEGFTAVPIAIDIKFRRYDDILKSQSPDAKTMPITTSLWHFGRGMAFASKGDLSQARSEREKMMALKSKMAPELMFGMLNKAHHVLDIAQHTIDAKIAAKEMKYDVAEKHLRQAIALEDDLTYMEPPDWLMPSREALGGVLLAAGDPNKAEQVFREDLERSPRGGRSLFGLVTALKKQGKDYQAQLVQRQLDNAWKNADTQLSAEDL